MQTKALEEKGYTIELSYDDASGSEINAMR